MQLCKLLSAGGEDEGIKVGNMEVMGILLYQHTFDMLA
jgi:hypothetical protein